MITAAVSLSPIVVAQQLADNHIQQKIAMKVLTDQINAEADLTAKIVSGVTSVENGGNVGQDSSYSVDILI